MKEILELWVFKVINWIGSVNSLLIHTVLFITIFALMFFGVAFNDVLLILTTLVSLEAIYTAIFIQMIVNKNTKSIEVMHTNIEEMNENIEDVMEDIEEIKDEEE